MVAVGAHLINMYRTMKKLMIGILGLTMAVACNSGTSNPEETNAQTTGVIVQQDISVEEASKMMNEGDVIFVDVRSLDEFSTGHIEGALNIDVSSVGFDEKIAELDKSKTYVVYCQSGRRSARSSELMVDVGFKTVYNVLGGVSEWKNSGYDVIVE